MMLHSANARGFLDGDKLQTREISRLTTFLQELGGKRRKYIYPFFFLQNYAVFRLSTFGCYHFQIGSAILFDFLFFLWWQQIDKFQKMLMSNLDLYCVSDFVCQVNIYVFQVRDPNPLPEEIGLLSDFLKSDLSYVFLSLCNTHIWKYMNIWKPDKHNTHIWIQIFKC